MSQIEEYETNHIKTAVSSVDNIPQRGGSSFVDEKLQNIEAHNSNEPNMTALGFKYVKQEENDESFYNISELQYLDEDSGNINNDQNTI